MTDGTRARTRPGLRSRFRTALALAMVLGGAAWLQHGGLVAPFFADDYLFLDQARGRSLAETLQAPDPIGNYFRPVSRQMWFWGLSAAAGESSPAFHAANLALFLLVLLLLYRLAGRLLPRRAALTAVGVLAVHHAADVPLLWASGSQDLLAVAGSLAAMELCAAGRPGWAALPMLMALLSKETVVFAPLIALLYDGRRGEPLSQGVRRAWPLFAAMLAWLGLWVLTTSNRPAIGLEVQLEPAGIPAALAHLAQTALGIEWPHDRLAAALRAPPPLPALAVVSGVALAGLASGARRVPRHDHNASARRHAVRVGVAWAVLGALPVAAVAQIWSAYHYLFALCGVALAVGGLVAAVPAWIAPLVVLLVGWTSENARRLPEFATARGPWTTQSHVNRHYLERGMTLAMRFLADLRRARPTLPQRSTLYFAGLPSTIAFQSADGPLVRWAYGDTTLRSYFLTRFQSEQARRRPTFFFRVQDDTLTEIQGADSLERIAFALILSDAPVPARDVLALAWDARPARQTAYRLAWVEAVRGDLDATRVWLAAAGHGLSAGPAPEIAPALARVAAGDTAGAIMLMEGAVTRHGLDAGAHALLADLLLIHRRLNSGTIEAYAARSLAPEAPSMWRRWGLVELVQGRDEQAALALERYLQLGGEPALEDQEIQTALRRLRRRLPGGAEAQAELGGHRFRRRSSDQ